MKQVRAPNGMRMGSFLDSIEQNDEGDKYIFATSLITLIGFITDKPVQKVAHYLRKSDFSQKVYSYYHLRDRKCYSKDMHNQAHGFDLNTKELLAECYHTFGFTEKYMTLKQEHEMDFDFYYLKEELQAIDCIKDLNIDFSLEWEAERAQSKWDDEVEKPIFRLSDDPHFEEMNDEKINGIGGLGLFRDKLIKLDAYSVLNAACLLSGDAPTEIHKFQDHLEFVQVFSEYVSFKLMIELAIKNNELKINDDKISAHDLKEYLGRNGYFFKGFNDFMAIEPAQPLNNKQIDSNELADAQNKIAELEQQLSKFQAAVPDVVTIPFGKRIDLTNKKLPPDERLKESYQIYSNDFSFHEDTHPVNTPDEMIKRIQGLLNVIKKKDNKIFELEQQTNTPANAQAEIDKLKEQLNKANTELAAAKTTTTDQPLDWQNMSEHVYPPELHLALMIWQRIYVDNELKDSHITSHGGKFKVIAKRLGLNPDNTLGKRVAMLINTAHSKNKQDELADPLRAIEQLYMPPKKEKTTS